MCGGEEEGSFRELSLCRGYSNRGDIFLSLSFSHTLHELPVLDNYSFPRPVLCELAETYYTKRQHELRSVDKISLFPPPHTACVCVYVCVCARVRKHVPAYTSVYKYVCV